MNAYGDLTPRQSGFSIARLLSRAMPNMVLERLGTAFVVPKNNTLTAKWRKYYLDGSTGSAGSDSGSYDVATASTALTEGVTPSPVDIKYKDYSVSLEQYGSYTVFTDVIVDAHEDMPQLIGEMIDILGESMAVTLEKLRYGVVSAGTNVYYAGGVSARADVASVLDKTLQARVVRALERQNAMPITSVVTGNGKQYEKQPVEAAFVAVIHPDCSVAVRNMEGFQSAKHYGGGTFPGELGQVDNVTYVKSTIVTAVADAGALVATGQDAEGMISTSGTNADVYPVLFFARDSYGTVVLRGANSARVSAIYPKASETDPLAQRGNVAWKTWAANVILQDMFLIRAEVTVAE